jgi:hypothetical protein
LACILAHISWLASILASRHSIICSISIVWQYCFLLQPPCHVFECDSSPTTSDTSCHVYEWLSTGFSLETGFIDHLQMITTSNYTTITNCHTLQITTVHTKSFQSAVTSHFLVTDLNNGDSSASILNCTD